MELAIKKIEEVKPIEFNYEELKESISQELKYYETMVYTEENLKNAKSDRAKLNKLATTLDEERKEMKNNFMKPYLEFEEKIKDLVGMVEKASKKVDEQIKSFENKNKQEKKDVIQAIYEENIGDLEKLVPFDKLFKNKWLNVSESISNIAQELMQEIERIKGEYTQLQKIIAGDSAEEQLKIFFFSILSLERTLAQKELIEEERKKINELSSESDNKTIKSDNLIEIKFKVLATNEQLALLSEFLIKNNIKYGRVN